MGTTLTRAISGVVYVALLITATLYSKSTFLLLFGILSIIGVIEFCKLVSINKTVAILANLVFYYVFNYTKITVEYENIALVFTLIISCLLLIFLFNSKIIKIATSIRYLLLIGYIILPFIWITKLAFQLGQYESKILIAVFIIIWCNDTFAYLFGRTFGKTKLFEKVSPKKTVEGFLGGVFFGIIASVILSKYYLKQSPNNWLIYSFIICVFGTLGDLIESKFKRMSNVKDSGNIMPGHGGILDRLDSIIFVAPILIITFKIIEYVS